MHMLEQVAGHSYFKSPSEPRYICNPYYTSIMEQYLTSSEKYFLITCCGLSLIDKHPETIIQLGQTPLVVHHKANTKAKNINKHTKKLNWRVEIPL